MAGFPNGPTLGDIYTLQAASWRWDGVAWKAYAISSGITGPAGTKGNTGATGPTGPTGPTGEIPTNYVQSIRGLTGIVDVVGTNGIKVTTSGKTLTLNLSGTLSQVNLEDINNTNISFPQTGQALFYDGTDWVNDFIAGGIGATGATGPTGPVGDYVESINGLTGTVTDVVRYSYGASAPTESIQQGHKWFNSDDGREYTYLDDGDSTQWVQLNGGSKGPTGPTGATGDPGIQGPVGPTGFSEFDFYNRSAYIDFYSNLIDAPYAQLASGTWVNGIVVETSSTYSTYHRPGTRTITSVSTAATTRLAINLGGGINTITNSSNPSITNQFDTGIGLFQPVTAVPGLSLSYTGNGYELVAGFTNLITATPSAGAYFRYKHTENSGRFLCVCSTTSGGETSIDSGITYEMDKWYDMQVKMVGASFAYFSIDNNLVATITENIPYGIIDRISPSVSIRRTELGVTAIGMSIDYINFNRKF